MIGECFVGSVGTAEIGNLKRKFWCGRLMGKLLGLLVQMVSQSTWRLYRHTSNTTLGVLWLYFKNRVHVLEPPQVACQMFRNSARRKKLWCLNQIRFSLYAPSMGCLLASFSSIQAWTNTEGQGVTYATMKLVRDWCNKTIRLVATHANKQPAPSDKRFISRGQQHCLAIDGHHFLKTDFVIDWLIE